MAYENIDGGFLHDHALKIFTVWVLLAQAAGLLAVILVAVWMSNYHGGFSWSPDKVFNFHPLFMVIGMVFLYADAILVYRVFRQVNKLTIKIIHASLHVLALIFAIIGLKAVFDSHNLVVPPKNNMYSLHSWLGLSCVVLFCVQWVCGFLSFLYPKAPEDKRKLYLPAHQYWGVLLFVGCVVTAIVGVNEKNAFHSDYSNLPAWAKISNLLGFVLAIFGALVVYIVTKPQFQRVDAPASDTVLLQPTASSRTEEEKSVSTEG